MKVLKQNCPVAQKIRKIMEVMENEGVEITSRGDGLLISISDKEGEKSFVILDADSKDIEPVFPPLAEYYIQYIDDYIEGN